MFSFLYTLKKPINIIFAVENCPQTGHLLLSENQSPINISILQRSWREHDLQHSTLCPTIGGVAACTCDYTGNHALQTGTQYCDNVASRQNDACGSAVIKSYTITIRMVPKGDLNKYSSTLPAPLIARATQERRSKLSVRAADNGSALLLLSFIFYPTSIG
ncbi:jg10443 [Pararge aegeria aegeria]|uniref:Jg10443 protein n=1 Tax=Pararge aegeria aegeria TaxID=348720 RepID=A0A8S4RHL5_9NEOP|nr:jg10443 [Pararge aegeria aegeria]